MKPSTLIAFVAGIVIPLQGTTFYYVVGVEARLKRLETIIELQMQTRRPPQLQGGASPQAKEAG